MSSLLIAAAETGMPEAVSSGALSGNAEPASMFSGRGSSLPSSFGADLLDLQQPGVPVPDDNGVSGHQRGQVQAGAVGGVDVASSTGIRKSKGLSVTVSRPAIAVVAEAETYPESELPSIDLIPAVHSAEHQSQIEKHEKELAEKRLQRAAEATAAQLTLDESGRWVFDEQDTFGTGEGGADVDTNANDYDSDDESEDETSDDDLYGSESDDSLHFLEREDRRRKRAAEREERRRAKEERRNARQSSNEVANREGDGGSRGQAPSTTPSTPGTAFGSTTGPGSGAAPPGTTAQSQSPSGTGTSGRPTFTGVFRRQRAVAEKWTEPDTNKFFEALRQFGTDFSLIEQLFPSRTRKQVKLKFKREERTNPMRVEAALKSRRPIDLEEYQKRRDESRENARKYEANLPVRQPPITLKEKRRKQAAEKKAALVARRAARQAKKAERQRIKEEKKKEKDRKTKARKEKQRSKSSSTSTSTSRTSSKRKRSTSSSASATKENKNKKQKQTSRNRSRSSSVSKSTTSAAPAAAAAAIEQIVSSGKKRKRGPDASDNSASTNKKSKKSSKTKATNAGSSAPAKKSSTRSSSGVVSGGSKAKGKATESPVPRTRREKSSLSKLNSISKTISDPDLPPVLRKSSSRKSKKNSKK